MVTLSLVSILTRRALLLLGIGCALAPAYAELSRAGVTATSGNTTVTLSDKWGGACVSLTYKGNEFVEVNDAGRLLQFSTYGKQFTPFTSDGYAFSPSKRIVVNPNQAGDALLKPSRILWTQTLSPTTVQSKSIPREWFTHHWPEMDAQGGAEFSTSYFKTRAEIISGYDGKVIKFTCTFRAPTAANWRNEIPALYLLGKYRKYYGVDAGNNTMTGIVNTSLERVVYLSPSKVGGMIATTTADGVTIGVYTAAASVGGYSNESWNGLCRTFSSTVTKIAAESPEMPLAADAERVYITHIVVGDSPADVRTTMNTLYKKGVR